MVAAPTGAPGEAEEAGSSGVEAPREPGADAHDPAWEAEAERLRRDRPPHWG